MVSSQVKSVRRIVHDIAKATVLRDGAIRRVAIGPLRGMVFRVGHVTQMSPWYSGTERDHQNFLRMVLRPGDVAIDVGANWGIHTLYMAKLVGTTGLVIAAEPLPEAFAELCWHVKANHLANVRPVNCAIGAQDGEARFQIHDSASQGKLLDSQSAVGDDSAIPVTVRSLDSLTDELGVSSVHLIKIDVEGGESDVLAGASSLVTRFRPVFVIDLHRPDQDLAVGRKLTDWNYSIERLSGPPILDLDLSWPDPNGIWGSIGAKPR